MLPAACCRAIGVTTALVSVLAARAARPQPVELRAGLTHTCARFADGTVRCWGRNVWGQLGDGTTEPASGPRTVVRGDGAPLDEVMQLSVGGNHGCALRRDGTIWCWGYDHRGQLGRPAAPNAVEPCDPRAAPVAGLGAMVAVAAGGSHTCALDRDGRVWCWGDNLLLQRGDLDRRPRPTPAAIEGLTDVVQIAVGDGHGCARRRGGSVRCWGSNVRGQLGDGTRVDRPAPTEVIGVRGAVDLALGWTTSCAHVAGGWRCWGSGGCGQLGDGDEGIRPRPAPLAGSGGARVVTLGVCHGCAIVGGGVWCWGSRDTGQLGDGHIAPMTRPGRLVRVAIDAAIAISAGGNHTCALLRGGAVRCWGANAWGQLGDGATVDRALPVPMKLDAGGPP